MNTLKELEKLSEGTGLKTFVATWILSKNEDYDQLESVFEDLFYGGCASGIVSELIYYTDTVAFYDKHKDEIWKLAIKQAGELGYDHEWDLIFSLVGIKDIQCDGTWELLKDTQFKNVMAWYAFEETAREISYELEIEN